MPRKQVATRLDEQTVEAFEDYVENEQTPDRNNADAFRRFVREGLAKRDYSVPVADGGTANEIDTLKQKQKWDARTHDALLLGGIAYIILTLTQGYNGIGWLAVGVIGAALLFVGTYVGRVWGFK
jgi:hypothetical protein